MESLSLRHALLLTGNIVDYATRTLPAILRWVVEGQHTGFAMSVHYAGENFRLGVTTYIGVADEKKNDYWYFSREKDARLTSHPEHVSSAESMDESTKRYAGAVRSGCLILSISKFKPLDDEAVALAILTKMQLISRSDAFSISMKSGSTDQLEDLLEFLPIE